MEPLLKQFFENNIELLDEEDYAAFLFRAAHAEFDVGIYNIIQKVYDIFSDTLKITHGHIYESKSNEKSVCEELAQILKSKNKQDIEVLCAWKLLDNAYFDAVAITKKHNSVKGHITAIAANKIKPLEGFANEIIRDQEGLHW